MASLSEFWSLKNSRNSSEQRVGYEISFQFRSSLMCGHPLPNTPYCFGFEDIHFLCVLILSYVYTTTKWLLLRRQDGVYVEIERRGGWEFFFKFSSNRGGGHQNHPIMEGALNCETRFSRWLSHFINLNENPFHQRVCCWMGKLLGNHNFLINDSLICRLYSLQVYLAKENMRKVRLSFEK